MKNKDIIIAVILVFLLLFTVYTAYNNKQLENKLDDQSLEMDRLADIEKKYEILKERSDVIEGYSKEELEDIIYNYENEVGSDVNTDEYSSDIKYDDLISNSDSLIDDKILLKGTVLKVDKSGQGSRVVLDIGEDKKIMAHYMNDLLRKGLRVDESIELYGVFAGLEPYNSNGEVPFIFADYIER